MYHYVVRLQDSMAAAGLTWRRLAFLLAFAALAGLALAVLTPLRVS